MPPAPTELEFEFENAASRRFLSSISEASSCLVSKEKHYITAPRRRPLNLNFLSVTQFGFINSDAFCLDFDNRVSQDDLFC